MMQYTMIRKLRYHPHPHLPLFKQYFLEKSPLQILGYGSTSQPASHDVRQHHLPSAANHQQPSS